MTDYGKIVIAIEGGEYSCVACAEQLTKQEDEPIIFDCENCGDAHIWHRRCLPPELEALVAQIERSEKAALN